MIVRALRLMHVATIVALAGCSLGPAYHRPQTPEPSAWIDAASGPAAWPSADWWRGFGSPELDQHIAQAQRANNDLAAALARVQQADALARVAGAALLPQAQLNAIGVREKVFTTAGGYTKVTEYSPQLAAAYAIDFWGKNRAAQEAAIASAHASRYDRQTVELTVQTGVALSYFQVLALQDRLAVAEANLQIAETVLEGLRLMLSAGIATALDVAQQETTVATLSASVPPLRQQLQQAADALAVLGGELPSSQAAAGTLADVSAPAIAPGLPSELLARRPDVAEAEAQLVAANANIKVARAAFFPSIQLTASGGYASTALTSLFRPASNVYAVGASLAQPIFEGGALLGQYDFAKARNDELVADYRKTVLAAFGNVEDALAAVKHTEDQVARQETAVAKAQRAHDIAQAQLRSGTVTILTVLNTETALFTAQDSLVQARLARLQARVSLFSALGGGWQRQGAGT